MFNALNTIRYFVRTDVSSARRLLVDLANVFQHALHAGDFVPLQGDIGYIEAYLALEKARLGMQLHVEWCIASATDMNTLVPTLILQPVVENAVTHGISETPEGGTLSITIDTLVDQLRIVVQDTGVGIASEQLSRLLAVPDGLNNANY